MDKNLKILVVDDQQFMFMIIEKALRENGFKNIDYAPNGIIAIDMNEANNYDLITCDITMPAISGIETAKMILEKEPNKKIIMVTAMAQRAIIREALHAGLKHYLIKPFTPEKLMEIIKEALNN